MRSLLGVVLVALLAMPAGADSTFDLELDDNTYSYVCNGGDRILLRGSNNEIAITGECTSLAIAGSNNRISIEAVGLVRISGDNNDVVYDRGTNGKAKPKVKKKGASNTVRKR